MSASLKGIVCMLAGSALLTLNDALLKWLSAGLPIGEILAVRGVVALALIGVIAWRLGGLQSLRINNIYRQSARAVLTVVATFCFVFGLRLLPLADAIAITFAGPLFLTLLAALALGERVGWRRWSAVAVGFIGVLVMVRPGSSVFNWAALLPLAASFLGALRDTLTRQMSASESSLATLAFTLLAVTFAGLATLPLGWQPLAAADLGLLIVVGILVVAAQFLLIETFRHAEASLVAPFKYFSFLWATLYGALLWQQWPGPPVLAGALLVIASGVYILRREAQLSSAAASKRRARAPCVAPPPAPPS